MMIPESVSPYRFTFHASRIKRGQVILRHTELTAYVASFRTWRGSQGSVAQGPPYL